MLTLHEFWHFMIHSARGLSVRKSVSVLSCSGGDITYLWSLSPQLLAHLLSPWKTTSTQVRHGENKVESHLHDFNVICISSCLLTVLTCVCVCSVLVQLWSVTTWWGCPRVSPSPLCPPEVGVLGSGENTVGRSEKGPQAAGEWGSAESDTTCGFYHCFIYLFIYPLSHPQLFTSVTPISDKQNAVAAVGVYCCDYLGFMTQALVLLGEELGWL